MTPPNMAARLLQVAEQLQCLNHHTAVPFYVEAELMRAYAGAPDLYEGLNRLAQSLSTKAVTLRARGAELEADTCTSRPAGWAAEDARELDRLVVEMDALLRGLGGLEWAEAPCHPRTPGEERWTHVGTVHTDRGWADLYYEREAAPEPMVWVRTGGGPRGAAGMPASRVSDHPQSWGLFGLAYTRVREMFELNPPSP